MARAAAAVTERADDRRAAAGPFTAVGPFTSEAELYAPVKGFLQAQGYDVKAEVNGCDLVARRGDEPPVIIELKMRLTLRLILQGVDRLALTDEVYLAVSVPAQPPPGSLWRRERRAILRLCRRLGLGLLAVHEPTRSRGPLVEPLLDPLPYRPRRDGRRERLLLREFSHRVGDPNVGGVSRRPIMTAYRQAALACAEHLRSHGPTKASDVREATGVERAATIMRNDVYGWFVRVDRGVYTLSPKGSAALAALVGDVEPPVPEAVEAD